MKGYFLIPNARFLSDNSGIGKKIQKQIGIFNDNALQCTPLLLENKREALPKLIGDILYALPFSNISPVWKLDERYEDIDYLYFRRPELMNFAARRFFRQCREKGIKLYMEIPTYPYDSEFKGFKQKINLLRDRFNRKKLRHAFDCVFVIDPMKAADSLFQSKTVRFVNGYDTRSVTACKHVDNGVIDLTCVGMFSFWHGYERLLKGLKTYTENNPSPVFHIHMVGAGTELARYQRLAEEFGLSELVTFYGPLFGEKLDEVYAITDIGVGCLGCYKKDIRVISDLKTREYLAKGIPVVSGCTVDLFDGKNQDFPYYLEIENTPDPVDFDLLAAYDAKIRALQKCVNVTEEIRAFSRRSFDMADTMAPIIKEIKENL